MRHVKYFKKQKKAQHYTAWQIQVKHETGTGKRTLDTKHRTDTSERRSCENVTSYNITTKRFPSTLQVNSTIIRIYYYDKLFVHVE